MQINHVHQPTRAASTIIQMIVADPIAVSKSKPTQESREQSQTGA
jgi:hypothetical protein